MLVPLRSVLMLRAHLRCSREQAASVRGVGSGTGAACWSQEAVTWAVLCLHKKELLRRGNGYGHGTNGSARPLQPSLQQVVSAFGKGEFAQRKGDAPRSSRTHEQGRLPRS